ncbi:GntR family transcriptional regulator [Roseateles toxinivorans]|uniref:DNA-binding GntR family transcriptional regulator n=1 Tax=Roseateles toxinivorans TaxID=270368 RepID=A0A4R6QV42_9BURK|nr:GntR family transcriptional regulator [Roseateles toxinivorans]TDP75072.1 DNA-binding GntR family transcriptional regulator [Roseateles toxinivorans]
MSSAPSSPPAPRQTPVFAPQALYEQVAERLRQEIFARELQPGSWIDELRLAQAWGISRTPLREALKVLATEGLVTMKLRRGAYVTEMSQQDVAEVYHLLSVLESDAAAEVAIKATDDQLAALNQLHQQLELAIAERTQFFALNEAFHMQVLEVAGNRWRTQIVTDLRKVMKLNRHLSLFKQGRLAESLDEHRRLMQALLARDAQAAQQLVREHFHNGLAATV